MENLKEETKIKAFLTRIKTEWPGVVERFEFKTGSVIYVHLKEGISSMDFLGKLSRQVERFVDFSMPIILYHIESDGMNLRSHPINWYSSITQGKSF
ncbi:MULTISPECIES: hypothetical protein [Pedobacter]|uniref:Uncharacterized protein n=1 Tax=Pedobacter riviphilus TaxID=2766984 RepID=A0ABX6TBS0_9SPHI|nr:MULTISPECIES: hypothetical protein [Pedobacter]MBB6237247.1 hypothetical protein [Pedobacter sp. AK013]NII83550.1 hypothetical protein [Pedobacter sp. SG908]NMN37412.1 hypothetical protein [Pedobacter sp. SG918]QDW25713.1 hypothetical protein FFJ24_013145 [Pedobacter sp. KBS0701]QNR82757.1 hypothetical protein H9N25_12180 [Pedobacter riviphilus]